MRSLLRTAACLAALALGWTAAWAQDARNGGDLYTATLVSGKRGCSNAACHGTLPGGAQNRIANGIDAHKIKSAISTQSQMQFLGGRLSDEELNDLAAYIAGQMGGTPTYLTVAAAPRPTVAPTGIHFGTQPVGETTPVQTVTVGNAASATAALLLGDIGVTAGSDFAIAGGTCAKGQQIAAGGSCTVALTFRPTLSGTRSGTLTVAHNGAGGASTVGLTGLGGDTAPSVSISPTQLTFSQAVGSTSGSQRVVVSNTGEATLVIDSVQLTGTSAADYALGSGSTCTAGATVAVSSNCVLDLRFSPAAQGTRNAAVTLKHNAGSGLSTVALVGEGTAAPSPNMTLNATRLDLGTQALGLAGPPRTLEVGNAGAASLSISGIDVSGPHAGDIVLGGTCKAGSAVAPGSTCTVTVALKPSALGTRVATLDISSNTPSGTASVSLAGEAIAQPAPSVSLAPVALGFGRVTLGTTSSTRLAILTNSGSAALDISSIASSSSEFALTHDCPSQLAAGSACSVGVSFTPAGATAAERVQIVSNAFSSPNSIVLTGQGVSSSLPVLAWQGSETRIAFESTEVGQTRSSDALTLVNHGPGVAAVSAFGLAGVSPQAFSVGGGTCLGGVRLAEGESCTVIVSFVPDNAGNLSATLLVASDGENPAEIALSGVGAARTDGGGDGGGGGNGGGGGGGGGNLSSPFVTDQGILDFRAIVVRTGGRSEPLVIRITNQSNATATLSGASTTGGFIVQAASAGDACASMPWTLAPGASCTLAVQFAPSTGGEATGTLRIVAADTSVLEVPLQAEAHTEVTNVGAGAGSFEALAGLGLIVLLLAWTGRPSKVKRGNER
ncbi:choice-of-anchor D domain-containing protein [Ideonella sp. YS5]|uniref:choice-of-anchor D domain-containing protein n=1 Tax=Ideonella sp. YS5 TaxID=3453714 RepID=UPI003EE97104